MPVIATAGHVDHGKSALVRALTGIEPDRWTEERKRGLTIDLGYAWTMLDGEPVAFVDVPGHQRFIGNMLAGIGPAAAVMFIVAADEGWRAQSAEHLLAIDALGIEHGLLVVTRSDLADPAATLDDARERLARTSLGQVEAVAVSARTGDGIPELREALSRFVSALPVPRRDGRTRMWIDRSFSIRGSGTVVTGTLGEGTLRVDERVRLLSPGGAQHEGLRIRGLQSLDEPQPDVAAVARTAVNLPAIEADASGRGDVLLTGDWRLTDAFDGRLRGAEADALPDHLMLHLGTYAAQVRVRPLGAGAIRLQMPDHLPLVAGDRAILRNPGTQHIVGGIEVLDADPPQLRRRGSAAHRAATLASADHHGVTDYVVRRGAVTIDALTQLGLDVPDGEIDGVRRIGGWLVADTRWQEWAAQLAALLRAQEHRDPLEPSVAEDAVVRALAVPQRDWLGEIALNAHAEITGGRVQRVGAAPDLGPAERGLAAIEQQLGANPWASPEQHDLDAAGLGTRELAAAVRLGRIVRLPGDIVLLPTGPARAMQVLAKLPQPFTTSDARQALGTTRRVAIPLLEHLDARGWTRRLDGTSREVAR